VDADIIHGRVHHNSAVIGKPECQIARPFSAERRDMGTDFDVSSVKPREMSRQLAMWRAVGAEALGEEYPKASQTHSYSEYL